MKTGAIKFDKFNVILSVPDFQVFCTSICCASETARWCNPPLQLAGVVLLQNEYMPINYGLEIENFTFKFHR